jgi:hypothetical protein
MDSQFIKVEGHESLRRDLTSNAIINTNMDEYQSYKILKMAKEKENERIENLENDVNGMKDDLSEIKNLLRNLVDGSK